MIGLMVLFGGVGYVLLARFITKLVFKKTERLLYKRLAVAFFVLLPTWDVIIGFPVFWYLCKFHSGVEIYETVDDVDGYYVGEQHKLLQPIMPADGYKYVDYTLKYSDAFFRSKWLDNSTDPSCYQPTARFVTPAYKNIFKSGKCVSVTQILEKDISRYEVITAGDHHAQVVPFLKIEKIVSPIIIDRQKNKKLAKIVLFRWDQGWVKKNLTIGGGPWVYSQDVESSKVQNGYVDASSILVKKTLKNNR